MNLDDFDFPSFDPADERFHVFFDREGKPIDAEAFSRLKMDRGYTVLAQDSVADPSGDEVGVSTVWVGTDLSLASLLHPDLPPRVFETMVFGGPHDLSRRRSHTATQALRDHAEVVALVAEGLGPDGE